MNITEQGWLRMEKIDTDYETEKFRLIFSNRVTVTQLL